MNRKNFHIKKDSNCSTKIHRKTQSNLPTQDSWVKRNAMKMSDQHKQQLNVFRSINRIWETVKELGVEISDSAILKFLHKFMEKKGYYFKDLILEILRTRSTTKKQIFTQDHPLGTLIYEIGKVKEELEEFLWRRFCRDIDIMEEKIAHVDEQIRDSLDQQEYERVTCSFRPLLISNPADLVHEYQNIDCANIQRNMSRLQQMRYGRLALSSRRISNMHNLVCEEKSGIKLLRRRD